MAHDTEWSKGYEERTKECVDAALKRALTPAVRYWPISGLDARKFNPNGFEPVWPEPAKDPLGTRK